LTDGEAKELVEDLAGRGIEISGLGYYPNPLDPDPKVRSAARAPLGVLIGGAAKLGVPGVNPFIGADAAKPLGENIAAAREFLPDLVSLARDSGVKLAIENCPMIFSQDEWPGGHNLFYAPATWREAFGWFDHEPLRANPAASH